MQADYGLPGFHVIAEEKESLGRKSWEMGTCTRLKENVQPMLSM